MARLKFSERKTGKLAELDRIKAELAEMDKKAADKIGKIALAAGLCDIDIDEADLRKEFEAIASKFRGGETRQADPVATTPGAD